MRSPVLVLAAACLLLPSFAHAQAAAAKPQTPPPAAAKPAAPAADRKEIKVPEKALKTFVGDYSSDPERVLHITFENGSLWGQPGTGTRRQLFAETPTRFFLKDAPIELTFKKDPKGTVTGLMMKQGDRPEQDLKKIK